MLLDFESEMMLV